MANVSVVEAHLAFEWNVASSADLPETGKARGNGKAHLVPWQVFGHFGRKRRTRSHDRHIASEDVEQLRQFVQTEFAEDVAHRVDARIVLHLEGRAAGFVELLQFLFARFRIDVHAAEFVHGKELAILADARLLKDNRPLWIAELDDQGAGEKHRRKQDDSAKRRNNVKSPLDDFLDAKRNLVGLGKNIPVKKTLEREEPVVSDVELGDGFVEFLVLLFLQTCIDACLENRLLCLFS